MKILVRAVISGFGFTLGAALFKKISDKLGLGEDKSGSDRNETRADPDAVIGNKEKEPDGLGSPSVEGV